MKKQPLETDTIIKRINGIQIEIAELQKYRNRIVHFYAQITPEEYYGIIKNNLGDFDIFLSAIKKVLEHPQRFGLEAE